jgi:LmbE family N-acetylglucosaminyl deacetylase
MKKNIVYIGAHPDDILTAAGTLCLLAEQGCAVHEFCMTRGEGLEKTIPNAGVIRPREEEEVCAIIGASLKFFDQPDGGVYASKPICETVAADLAELQPEAVFTLWALEKPDHSATCEIARKALGLAGLTWKTELYMAKVDVQHYCFKPDTHVNVGSVMGKVEAIARCYDTQGGNPYIQHTLAMKRLLGKALFVEAAEPFMFGMDPINWRFHPEGNPGRLLRALRP